MLISKSNFKKKVLKTIKKKRKQKLHARDGRREGGKTREGLLGGFPEIKKISNKRKNEKKLVL